MNGISGFILTFFVVLVPALNVGVGLTTSQRHYETAFELEVDASPVCTMEGGRDGCHDALTSTFGRVLGVPTAVWGTAVHVVALFATLLFVAGVTTARMRLALAAWGAFTTIAAFAVLGSLTFVGVLLATNTHCGLCLTMHVGNAVFALLAIAVGHHWWSSLRSCLGILRRWGWRVGALISASALAATIPTAILLRSAYAEEFTGVNLRRQQNAGLVRAHAQLLERCPQGRCAAPLAFPRELLPPAAEALRLRDAADGPVVVEALDMTCKACARDFVDDGGARMEALRSAQGVDEGLWLLLWPHDPACNPDPDLERPDWAYYACEANAAALCAFRHPAPGQDPAVGVLRYTRAQLELVHTRTPTTPFPGTREAWLRQNVSTEAAQCLAAEAAGQYPLLRAHAATVRTLRDQIRAVRPECSGDTQPWWCLKGTPFHGVFSRFPAAALDTDSGKVTEVATGLMRWKHVMDCVAASPNR